MGQFFQSVTVKSSLIDRVAYDNGALSVQLKSGAAYTFNKVPKEVAADFLRAKSKGRFFGQEIVGQYDSEKIEVAS